MSGANETPNWLTALIAVLVLALAAGVVVLIFVSGDRNRQKDVQLQQACVEAGGTYLTEVGCLQPERALG